MRLTLVVVINLSELCRIMQVIETILTNLSGTEYTTHEHFSTRYYNFKNSTAFRLARAIITFIYLSWHLQCLFQDNLISLAVFHFCWNDIQKFLPLFQMECNCSCSNWISDLLYIPFYFILLFFIIFYMIAIRVLAAAFLE